MNIFSFDLKKVVIILSLNALTGRPQTKNQPDNEYPLENDPCLFSIGNQSKESKWLGFSSSFKRTKQSKLEIVSFSFRLDYQFSW